MAAFEIGRDYPLAQILDESSGSWIVPGLVKGVSPSEAVVLLHLSEKHNSEVVFPSSQECLIRFYFDKAWPECELIESRLCALTKLWVLVAAGPVVTALRVVSAPLSFTFSIEGTSTLTVAMEPSLSGSEWHQLGLRHIAMVTINEGDGRYICSNSDVQDLCAFLGNLRSFYVHVSRFEGDSLDLTADAKGVVLDYLDIKRAARMIRGAKMISINSETNDSRIVRMRVDALPYLDVETERRHLIPIDRGLHILRTFLTTGKAIDMVPWPDDT